MTDPVTQVVHNTSLMTVDSIIQTIRAFKDGTRSTDYEAGFDDGIDQAIRAVQLFKTVLETKQKEQELSE